MAKRLYKIEYGRKIFGVCGGVAEYFNVDVVLVRILWACSVIFWGASVFVYIVCAFVLPNKSEVSSD